VGLEMFQKRRIVIWMIWLKTNRKLVIIWKKDVHLKMILGQIIEILTKKKGGRKRNGI